jgi:carbohydrate-binding DOMON domain-containing protein
MLLPGRNTRVNSKYAWDYVIWVEGWMQHFYKADLEGKPVEVDTNMIVNVDPVAKTITIRIPKSVLGENPADWAYIAMINGQEGFPSVGNWRVRDVNKESAQWRFGGGDDGLSDPNVIDIALPKDYTPSQEDMLSGWNPSTATSLDNVDINDFCEISGVTIEDILD